MATPSFFLSLLTHHTVALPNLNNYLLIQSLQYSCVTTPPAVMPTLLRQADIGSLLSALTLGECRTHEGESSTNRSAQELVSYCFWGPADHEGQIRTTVQISCWNICKDSFYFHFSKESFSQSVLLSNVGRSAPHVCQATTHPRRPGPLSNSRCQLPEGQ